MPTLHDRVFEYLSTTELYAILQLRAAVFVVDQACAYLDPDGRDVEPTARHIWFEDDAEIVAIARWCSTTATPAGLVAIATRVDHRGAGLAGRLVEHFVATGERSVAAQRAGLPGRLVRALRIRRRRPGVRRRRHPARADAPGYVTRYSGRRCAKSSTGSCSS